MFSPLSRSFGPFVVVPLIGLVLGCGGDGADSTTGGTDGATPGTSNGSIEMPADHEVIVGVKNGELFAFVDLQSVRGGATEMAEDHVHTQLVEMGSTILAEHQDTPRFAEMTSARVEYASITNRDEYNAKSMAGMLRHGTLHFVRTDDGWECDSREWKDPLATAAADGPAHR